jgi:hypothetical protein
MKSSQISSSPWTTASFGGAPDTTPMELSALGEHLGHCRDPHGRWFAVRCAFDGMNGFVSSRFVTTLVLAMFLMVVAALIL